VLHNHVDDATELDAVEAAGGRWVRLSLSWERVEPSKGDYDWAGLDAMVLQAHQAGMQVFAMFTRNPSWAAELPGGPVYSLQDLVRISRRMTERYDCDGVRDAPGSPCVQYWSFYGEPDNWDMGRALNGKGYWGHNGAGYARMLAHISPVIHAANPNAKVILGGLAYDWFEEEGGPFVRAFLGDTLGALNTYPGGAKAYIDAVAIHYYPISSQRWPTIREKMLEVRATMSRHGVGDLPLLCPEGGYWSSAASGSSETEQAQRLVQIYVRALSAGVPSLAWYTVADGPNITFGLLRADLSRKPAYFAYRALARELEHAYYRRPFQHANVEGYVFQVGRKREMTVLWAKTSTVNVAFPYACLRRVHTLGYEEFVADGGAYDRDGVVNGQVAIRVRQNEPAYVERCP
jgi:hypothetical protein